MGEVSIGNAASLVSGSAKCVTCVRNPIGYSGIRSRMPGSPGRYPFQDVSDALDPGRQTAKSIERMIDDWRKLLSFFSAGEKRQILLLLLSTTVSGLVQAIGVASIAQPTIRREYTSSSIARYSHPCRVRTKVMSPTHTLSGACAVN